MAYSNGYTYKRDITIDSQEVLSTSDLTNYPLLINETYSYLADTSNAGDVENSNGYDIIFEDGAGNQLDHAIEKYDNTTGQIIFWVKVPTVEWDNDTTIEMYYGNSSISTSQENVAGTFSEFAGVWWFNESAAPYDDKTGNNDGVNYNNQMTTQASGKINYAVEFDENNDQDIIQVNNLNLSGDITIMFWLYPINGVNNGGAIFEQASGYYRFYPSWRWRIYETAGTLVSFSPDSLSDNYWHHVAVRVSSGNGTYQYINGTNTQSDGTVDSLISTTNGFFFGGTSSAGQTNSARQSHLFIANKDLGEGYLRTMQNNQNGVFVFFTVGSEETNTTPDAVEKSNRITLLNVG